MRRREDELAQDLGELQDPSVRVRRFAHVRELRGSFGSVGARERVRNGMRDHDHHFIGRQPAAVDEPWVGQLWLPPTLLDEEGVGLWIDEMDFDPRPIFAQVRVPTLSFYGADDSWAPVEASAAAWREARGDEVEVVVVPGAEHDMTLPDGSFAPEYEQKLVEWLTSL